MHFVRTLARVAARSAFVTVFLAASAGVASAADPPVLLADGAAATRDSHVLVRVAPPAGSASLLRLSNDGGTTWATISYALAFTWDLVDPAAGGVDADGVKTVTVEAGDGAGPWVSLGTDDIVLDRIGPVVSRAVMDGLGWASTVDTTVTDAGVGVERTDVSLDGEHWRTLGSDPSGAYPTNWIDVRDGTIGGSWALTERTLWVRGVDHLGNVGDAWTSHVTPTRTVGEYDPPATFAYPLPAVVGQPFTVAPVWDAGYRIPAGSYCFWQLYAGDQEARLAAMYNETLIRVDFSVPPKDGLCEPWTFTLPFTPPLEYSWTLGVSAPANPDADRWLTQPIEGSFRAAPGPTTSRAITASNLPLYYIVPDRELVDADGVVTYRLYRAGGAPARSGTWTCQPAIHPPSPGGFAPEDQQGGTSFRCHVTSTGAWEAGWVAYGGGRRWLVQYDPIGDRRAPTVTIPTVRPGTGVTPTAAIRPVDVSWSGHDKGTGIARYQLQRSINGGTWHSITLPTSRATLIRLRLSAASSYRFRVRARDRAGNWGAWSTTRTIRTSLAQETSSAFRWSSGWVRESAAGASGGAVRSAASANRAATFRFTGRAVGWVARRGPGQGFAQVRVDGVLVATINLEAPSLGPSQVIWRRSWGAVGTHSIGVRLLGTAGRERVEIDGMLVIR